MQLRPGICLLALISFVGLNARASAQASPVNTIWPIDDTVKIGGHAATILGQPQVITESALKSVHFNGATDGLLLPINPVETFAEFTIEVLLKPDRDGPEEQRFLHLQDELGSRGLMEIRLTQQGWALDTFLYSLKTESRCTLLDRAKLHPAERWTWVALVYAHGHMTQFINGVKELEGDVNFPPMLAGKISLGVRQNKIYWFKGGIREVRFHAAALDGEKLQHSASE